MIDNFRTIHPPEQYQNGHRSHHTEDDDRPELSPTQTPARQDLSSASLVVHEMPARVNGHHEIDGGVGAAFALYSLAQPALSLPQFIDRLPASLGSEDITFLSTKGAFHVPPRHVLQVILCRYVEFVHPALPLLDINPTMKTINDESGRSGRISILLLMAMIYAALPFVESKHVRGLGIESKLEARTLYYKKLKVS
jgi:hypothetical protein